MIISIASDHGGFSQKQPISEHLEAIGHEVIDRGPDDGSSVDYPDFAEIVARDVSEGRADIGILICGTGIGMAIAANKVKGVRAANLTRPEFAELARQHNDANVITLSGRFATPEENEAIVDAFLSAEFEGGRHARRVGKMMDLEQERSL